MAKGRAKAKRLPAIKAEQAATHFDIFGLQHTERHVYLHQAGLTQALQVKLALAGGWLEAVAEMLFKYTQNSRLNAWTSLFYILYITRVAVPLFLGELPVGPRFMRIIKYHK